MKRGTVKKTNTKELAQQNDNSVSPNRITPEEAAKKKEQEALRLKIKQE